MDLTRTPNHTSEAASAPVPPQDKDPQTSQWLKIPHLPFAFFSNVSAALSAEPNSSTTVNSCFQMSPQASLPLPCSPYLEHALLSQLLGQTLLLYPSLHPKAVGCLSLSFYSMSQIFVAILSP